MELEKITKSRQNEEKRRYDDACGLAHALELLGERWAMLVLRELAYGPRRFSELKADLPGISANVLTQRLDRARRRAGSCARRRLPPPASVQVYEATDWGLEVDPAHRSLGRWAARSPLHDPTLPMSHVSMMMSLQTLISPELAEGLDGAHRLPASARRAMSRRSATAGSTSSAATVEDCDVVFTGAPSEVAAVIHGGAPFDLIRVEGDMELAKRFVTLFPLPAEGRDKLRRARAFP